MKFQSAEEARQWLASLRCIQQQLRLKIRFFQQLIEDTAISRRNTHPVLQKIIDADRYRAEITALQNQLLYNTELFDQMMSRLSGKERCIMTAKYLNGVTWDRIEMHTYYSKRQALRIHKKALEQLTDIDWEVTEDEQTIDSTAAVRPAGSCV